MEKLIAVNEYVAVMPIDKSSNNILENNDGVDGIKVGTVFIENNNYTSFKKGTEVYYSPFSVLAIKIKGKELDVINVNNIMLCQ